MKILREGEGMKSNGGYKYIPVRNATVEKLKFLKIIIDAKSYNEVIEKLIDYYAKSKKIEVEIRIGDKNL